MGHLQTQETWRGKDKSCMVLVKHQTSGHNMQIAALVVDIFIQVSTTQMNESTFWKKQSLSIWIWWKKNPIKEILNAWL